MLTAWGIHNQSLDTIGMLHFEIEWTLATETVTPLKKRRAAIAVGHELRRIASLIEQKVPRPTLLKKWDHTHNAATEVRQLFVQQLPAILDRELGRRYQ